jgi:pimeloyl-ACP methyl ester carboxylesterase
VLRRVLAAALAALALSACGSSLAPGTASVVSAPVRVAHTRLGSVGYRAVGTGPPLVMIIGVGWTIEDWDPRLVHVLARHHRVIMFDNAGIGHTAQLPQPLTIDEMASQTSALIAALHLGRADVLGWSLGGAVAQALAVLHPAQVRRLVLCATYPGNGQAVVPTLAPGQVRSDFPANQSAALSAFRAAIAEYPAAPSAPPGTNGVQALALSDWWTGHDRVGHEVTRISGPALVADGRDDELSSVTNDRALARLIRHSRLVLYPDAGHAFLFQDWERFGTLVNTFLARPSEAATPTGGAES